MSGLFDTDTASSYMNRQLGYTGRMQRSLSAALNPQRATGPLNALSRRLGKRGLPGVKSKSNAYNMAISPEGKATLARTGETQGWMDSLASGAATADASYANLLQQLSPGYGMLTKERERALELEKRQATGDLRSQLAKRRVLGASFATDQQASLAAEYDRLKDQARAESIVAELDQTKQVITQRADAALKFTQQALQQGQFEGALQASLMQEAQNNLLKIKDLQVDLAKMVASITSASQIASAEVRGSLANTMAGSFASYAGLESQEKAGPANFIASILGAGLGYAGSGGFNNSSSGTTSGTTSGGGLSSFNPFK